MQELVKKSRRYHADVPIVAYHRESGDSEWWMGFTKASIVSLGFGTPAGIAYAIFDRYVETPEQQALLGKATLMQSRAQIAGSAAAGDAIRSGINAVGGAIGGAMESLAAHGRTGGGAGPRQHVH
ncbi:MAG: hypothetical protein QGI83_15845 [Candidatus Latescibacteria bacterium]|nr:hypothetical protein [Candidatus Latescibacterota bacterium]